MSEDNTLLDKATNRLLRGCFIKKENAGIFEFTNLAVRILKKIENIIREEHDNMNCLEVRLPILQEENLWQRSGRNSYCGNETFKLKDRKDTSLIIAPTAEESATNLIENLIYSYKQLPITIYQILEKYRDEMRPRFGLVRSRQFIMKDAYSFASNVHQAEQIYMNFFNLYNKIFQKLELNVMAVQADAGEIGGNLSHEFVVNSQIGEDTLYYDSLNNIKNLENLKDLERLETSYENKFNNSMKCLELGHIFLIGSEKYSENMKVYFQDENNEKAPFVMGCYGIGVTRILSVLANEKKYWPNCISPFLFYIIGINLEDAENLYTTLQIYTKDILFDDRDTNTKNKFNDAEIIGIPYEIVVKNGFIFNSHNENISMEFSNMGNLIEFLKTSKII
jgi:prolyl-tRNA synthetase